MRRHSDTNDGRRTGRGRRARDRLLTGEPPCAVTQSSELSNLLFFVGDDLREAALAVGGIEAFLVKVEELLGGGQLSARAVGELERYVEVNQRVEHLGDALDSLCRSLYRLREALATEPSENASGEQAPAGHTTV